MELLGSDNFINVLLGGNRIQGADCVKSNSSLQENQCTKRAPRARNLSDCHHFKAHYMLTYI